MSHYFRSAAKILPKTIYRSKVHLRIFNIIHSQELIIKMYTLLSISYLLLSRRNLEYR